jgi:hypothetical protein
MSNEGSSSTARGGMPVPGSSSAAELTAVLEERTVTPTGAPESYEHHNCQPSQDQLAAMLPARGLFNFASCTTTPGDGLFKNSCDTPKEDQSLTQDEGDGREPALGSVIRLGVCCMEKKLRSNTMQAMLQRFSNEHHFCVVPFEEQMILEAPVSAWPRVDVMIAFYSTGFPLEKAISYSQLYPHTYYLTHPESQPVLLDRRDVLSALARNNIPVPRSVWCSRDGYNGAPEPVVVEGPDFITVNGQRLDKPFVEKPASAEDHNVYIYHKGGGCSKLFRKKEDSCSKYHPEISTVRADGGSYIYEEFLETSNMKDVKCYTVGPNFVFAEERKAPVVDGIVRRDVMGKELRAVISLSVDEQMVARKVIKVFRQMVCGFDILRCKNKDAFYVCDVNGWSFVKNNDAYVVSATDIIAEIFRHEVQKRGLHRVAPPYPGEGRTMLGFVGVFRHADRTPKQKVKLKVSVKALLDVIFDSQMQSSSKRDGMKINTIDSATNRENHQHQHADATTVRPVGTDEELHDRDESAAAPQEVVFKTGHPKLLIIQRICEQMLEELVSSSGSEFDSCGDAGGGAENAFGIARVGDAHSRSVSKSLQTIIDVLTRQHEGLKIQVKPLKTVEESVTLTDNNMSDHTSGERKEGDLCGTGGNTSDTCADECGMQSSSANPLLGSTETKTMTKIVTTVTEAMFICKWGGWLTASGEKQSEMLGHNFVRRVLGVEPTDHCLKASEMSVRTNTERRVINTASTFAKALLCGTALDDNTLVVDEKLLGNTAAAKAELAEAQRHIARLLHLEDPVAIATFAATTPGLTAVLNCPVLEDKDRTPIGALRTLHRLVCNVAESIPRDATNLYGGEPLHLLVQRWENLATSFQHPRSGHYDVSKIPDICDYVSFDVCYNQESLAPLDLFPLFTLAEVLGALVSCAEFGATRDDKKRTAALIASPLMVRIRNDIVNEISQGRSPRTRMYFTSESHIVALKNLLFLTANGRFHFLESFEPLELNFLSHFVFKMYEYHHTRQIMIEVHFSSGIEKNMFGIVQEHHVQYGAVTPMIRIHNALTIDGLDKIASEYEALSSQLNRSF